MIQAAAARARPCLRATNAAFAAKYVSGSSLEGVREVRLHPLKFEIECGAPLLRAEKSTFFMKIQILRT